ncbi:right-handed parallel beta-helix repeat-containing protein [Candidatus Micrarchaeota archaeon]|nr:right-handed parallel beta-helix repeat-containing protein [Candidatus Micrarchaeota archaeon]
MFRRSSPYQIFLLFFVLISLSFAADITDCKVPNGAYITASGTYLVTQNIVGSSITANSDVVPNADVCIFISASDVTLDCQDFTVTSTGANNLVPIAVNGTSFQNIIIKNCNLNGSGLAYGIAMKSVTTGSNSVLRVNVTGAQNGIFINSSGSITVNSVNVSGSDVINGIVIVDSISNSITNSDISGGANSQNGVNITSISGPAYDNSVLYNNIHDIGTSTSNGLGVYLNAGGITVSNNNLSSVGLDGIQTTQVTSSNTLSSNLIWNNGRDGIRASGGSNTISGNSIHDNSQFAAFGIRALGGSDYDVISYNSVFNNSGGSGGGIVVLFGTGTNVTSNNISGNDIGLVFGASPTLPLSRDNRIWNSLSYGVDISSASSTLLNDVLFNNVVDARLNAGAGSVNFTSVIFDNPIGNLSNFSNVSLYITSLAPLDGITIQWTPNPSALPVNMRSLAQKYVNLSATGGAPTIDSLTFHWQDSDVVSESFESRLQLFKYNDSGWTLLNASAVLGLNTLSYSGLSSFSTFAILINDTYCPIVDSSGSYVLSSSLSGAPNPVSVDGGGFACVVVNASNVEFNCGGYSITNDGTVNSTGVLVSSGGLSNITLHHCPSIDNYTLSNVRASSVSFGVFDNLTVHNGVRGIYFDSTSANNNLTNLTIYNSSVGIYLQSGSYNTLRGNIIEGNYSSVNGVLIEASSSNNLSLINASRFVQGFGFTSSSENNTVVGTLAHNNSYGFEIESNLNTLSDNLAINNTNDGFHLQTSQSNLLLRNNASFNSVYGFYLYTGVNGTNLTSNYAFNNTQAGFSLLGGNSNDLFSNNANNNGVEGYLVQATNTSRFYYNFAVNTGNGFYLLDGSAHNTFWGNNATNSSLFSGFALEGVSNNTFTQNLAANNFLYGFYFYSGSLFNTLNQNNASSNIQSGFFFNALSNYNNLTNNTANGNSKAGFEIFNSSNSYLRNNSATNNQKGISLNTSAENNTLFNNSASGNSQQGISVEDARNASISENVLFLNSDAGIGLRYSNQSTLWLNSVYNNSIGISLFSGSYVQITNNTVYNNTNRGIDFDTSTQSNASGNAIYLNGESGLAVSGSVNTILSNNQVFNNSLLGIVLNSSTNYTTVSNNTAYQNNPASSEVSPGLIAGGFSVLSGVGNVFSANIAHDNPVGFLVAGSSSDSTNFTANEAYNNSIYAMQIDSANNTRVVSDHYYNQSIDLSLNNSRAGAVIVNLTSVVLDSILGNYTNYTNFSLSDSVASGDYYNIFWTTNSSTLPSSYATFANKYVNITNLSSNISIDSIVWYWTDNESSGSDESTLVILRYDSSSGWVPTGSSVSASNNTLTIESLSSFGNFAVLINNTVATSSSSASSSSSSVPLSSRLDVSVESGCGSHNVTVTYRGSSIPAHVEIYTTSYDLISSGSTNVEGKFNFVAACSKNVLIRVSTSMGSIIVSKILDCTCPTPTSLSCTSNLDCTDSQSCIAGQCTELFCPVGQIINQHICVSNQECSSDLDCPFGLMCSDNRCVTPKSNDSSAYDQQIPLDLCTSDSDCLSSEFCGVNQNGVRECTVVSIGSCGIAQDHQFVSFQCGIEPGCNPCTSGYLCSNHQCVARNLIGPQNVLVGQNATFRVLLGNSPLVNATIRVTDPSGRETTYVAGAGGSLDLVVRSSGVYKISLLDGGSIVKTVTLTAAARPSASSSDPLTSVAQTLSSYGLYLGIVFVLFVGTVYLLYLRRR